MKVHEASDWFVVCTFGVFSNVSGSNTFNWILRQNFHTFLIEFISMQKYKEKGIKRNICYAR